MSIVVLARILTPADFGLIGMVTVFVNFAMMFKDFGLSIATIQKQDLTDQEISNLFWINIGIGLILSIGFAAAANLITYFYGQPLLYNLVTVLSPIFFISSLSIQHHALLKRQMEFKLLSIVELSSIVVSIIIAITAAIMGAGYWALVYMQLSLHTVNTILTWSINPWLPLSPRELQKTKPLLAFGSNVAGFNIINYFARNSDNLIIGKFFGAATLGIYNKAYELLMLPITQIRNPILSTALPALSKLKDSPEKYSSYYSKLIFFIALFSVPFASFISINSQSIILFSLGENWKSCVDIFFFLSFAALIQPVLHTVGIVLISLGQSKRLFYLGIINSTVTVLAFLCGMPWGIEGIAILYSMSNYLMAYPILNFSLKKTPISIRLFFSSIYKPYIISLITTIAVYLLRHMTAYSYLLQSLLLNLIIFLLFFIVFWIMIFRDKDIFESIKLLRTIKI